MQDSDEPTSVENNNQLAYAGRCNGPVDGTASQGMLENRVLGSSFGG